MSVLSENSLGYDISFVVVDHDPEVENTDCAAGSLIIRHSDGNGGKPLYQKTVTGNNNYCSKITVRSTWDFAGVPGAVDDESKGYGPGSTVYNGVNLYKCVNGSLGEAVWLKTT